MLYSGVYKKKRIVLQLLKFLQCIKVYNLGHKRTHPCKAVSVWSCAEPTP